MILSWADRRLGAIEHDVVSLQGTGAGAASERPSRLHVVRDADCGPVAVAEPSPVDPPWVVTWKRGVAMQRDLRERELRARCNRERQYCEQIRDAKAEGRTPLSADEFFGTPTT